MLCSKCNVEKDESCFEFRIDTKKFRKTCKECRNQKFREKYPDIKEKVQATHKKNREKNKEHYTRQSRDRYWKNRTELLDKARKRPNYGKSNPDSAKRWYKNNKEKVLAHRFVKDAIGFGLLKPPINCQLCRNIDKLHAHHKDYSKPFDVLWLCPACHSWIHSKHAKETLFAHLDKQ